MRFATSSGSQGGFFKCGFFPCVNDYFEFAALADVKGFERIDFRGMERTFVDTVFDVASEATGVFCFGVFVFEEIVKVKAKVVVFVECAF